MRTGSSRQVSYHRSSPPSQLTEDYAHVEESGFRHVTDNPLSTFSVDTDTASYTNIRRFLNQGTRPVPDAVRIEEMVNYFSYSYAKPAPGRPFGVAVELAACPWQPGHQLLRVGLEGRHVQKGQRKPANLVFLLDVSGSMNEPHKLPLVQRSLQMAVEQLGAKDRVAIVAYAGTSGLVLNSTSFANRGKILSALDSLEAGGSTNGAGGIQLAYATAKQHFIPGGINRVILATDGDFNVGVTNKGQLIELVKAQAKENIFLTVLGFGMGNLKDDMLEKLADNGNGSYAYVDTFAEARKVFGQQIGGTLETIAKDVKIQIEFNPALVKAYRLIGYENRRLAARDFNDDTKDAGEIGAGHTVTAIYQIVPVGQAVGDGKPAVDALKYSHRHTAKGQSGELATLKLRYKEPTADKSQLLAQPLKLQAKPFDKASADLRFATAVAAFGSLLRNSAHVKGVSYAQVATWAESAKGTDPYGHRAELVQLVRKAAALNGGPTQIAAPGP